MAVAIARHLPEVWLSPQPFLLFSYLYEYFPRLSKTTILPSVAKKMAASIPRPLRELSGEAGLLKSSL
jgi:hypothetical protein